MISIDDVREKNRQMILLNNDNKFNLIDKMLKDDNCFFKMKMAIALDVLASLGFENPLEVYEDLIDTKNFKTGRKIEVSE